jgi:hypothetical protein
MRMVFLRVSVVLALATVLAQAQAISSPRRLSRVFQGEVPWIWTLEGSGTLQKAGVRFLDEKGQECWSVADVPILSLGSGQWQAKLQIVPITRFKGLGSGRFMAEWTLTWGTGSGDRQEITETAIRLEEMGEGWLQQAFLQDPDGAPTLTVGSQWQPGSSLNATMTGTQGVQFLQYQVVAEDQEKVIKPWTSLSFEKGSQWLIPSDTNWPKGMIQIWFRAENSLGRTWMMRREVLLGSAGGGLPSSTSSAAKVQSVPTVAAASAVMAAQVSVTAGPTYPSWMTSLNESIPPLWENCNRTATINVGYMDEERNDARLWPSDAARPMSLGLTGADGMAHPLYSISYLLSDWAVQATPIEMYADQALLATSNSANMPPGAATLAIGNVAAPVVVSAGVIKDFLDRPLAAGYGWAICDTSGNVIPAGTWTTSSTSAPSVGLDAIKSAALMRQASLSQCATEMGYSGEGTDLNGRNPFSLTVASQDVLGRPILSRGIGQFQTVNGSDVFSVIEVTNSPSGPAGLRVNEASSQFNAPKVLGFSRTQYGTVDLTDLKHGICTVSMVTDPDGSAVAEIKDPEGRTIYKIVNPSNGYCDLFRDFQDRTFQPSAPANRGTAAGTANVNEYQKDLLTQYVFDTEGHLRIVIPPNGTAKLGTWGVTNIEAELAKEVLSTSVSTGGGMMVGKVVNTSNAIAYATYNAYDPSGHLIGTYNPDEGLTRFRVDQKGRVYFSQTASQNKRNAWTRTYYDQLFRVLVVGEIAESVDDPAASDIEGNKAFVADYSQIPLGNLSSPALNIYDAYEEMDPTTSSGLNANLQSLLPKKVLVDGNVGIWSAFADGHLTRTEDSNSIERYFYDQDGRIVIRWVTIKGTPRTPVLSYTGNASAPNIAGDRQFAIGIYYDFAGRVKRLIYPSGPGDQPLQVVYTYDDLGRLYAVGTPEDTSYFARYAYLPTGEVRGIVYGPGRGFAAKKMFNDPQGWLRSLAVNSK